MAACKVHPCYAEVARRSGYALNEVKSHIQNGKRNLKILLTDAGLPPPGPG